MPNPLLTRAAPGRACKTLAASLLASLVVGCASHEPPETDLAFRWKDRLNLVGPSSPAPVGRIGEKLILAQAEVSALTMPMGRANSLQDDRAKVVFDVKKLPDDAPRPIDRIDLWCPDWLIKDHGWQVGTLVIVRLTPDYQLYDVAERN